MRISDWSSDVCSSDLKELARLERRDNRAPDTFGRRREDNLNAQREPLLNEQEPWSDSLYSESASERDETALQPPVEQFAPHEPARPPRTKPSLSPALEQNGRATGRERGVTQGEDR